MVEENGIVHTPSTPYCSNFTGNVKHVIKMSLDKIPFMLRKSGMPLNFWEEGLHYFALLHKCPLSGPPTFPPHRICNWKLNQITQYWESLVVQLSFEMRTKHVTLMSTSIAS